MEHFDATAERVRAGGVPIGHAFPDPELLSATGATSSISMARNERAAVVVLYRGAWCPHCNLALKAYQDHLQPALNARTVALIAISPQKPDGSLTMQEKHDLDFAVLSDPGNQVARALGVLTRPSEETLDRQRQHGLDITAVNADGTADLPMPTTAVVTAQGVLAWIDVHPDYKTRTEPDTVLRALDALGL